MRLARVLGAIGRTCITAGVLILLFVAYQLWGTGIETARAQNRLEDRFEQLLADVPEPTTPAVTVPTSTSRSPVRWAQRSSSTPMKSAKR